MVKSIAPMNVASVSVPVNKASMSAAPKGTATGGAATGRRRLKKAGRRRCPVLALVRRLTVPVRARGREAGTTTAEYAIGTLAACAFAAVLYKIVTSQSVADLLSGTIHRALGSAG